MNRWMVRVIGVVMLVIFLLVLSKMDPSLLQLQEEQQQRIGSR